MEDSDFLCPLCCEELDISDRNFYPCKCGYQVCMWCWHRIRESESGTCPACRTPYGDDPHEFSAVDVEEVLRANREKAAMEKKMNQQQQHLHMFHPTSNINSTMSSSMIQLNNANNNNHQQHFSNNTNSGNQGNSNYHHNLMLPNYVNSNIHNLHTSSMNHTTNHNAIPNSSSLANSSNQSGEDRTSLANMRVIRRNLVYAVGLPPHSEEILRKPEYFGQYGKIQKIVLNRNHPPAGDARRPSASAYVTFCHKEDSLACILALDGFYLDGRNIRASYGTSKYCSAFIKNVRCNNPDCTYLHTMGEKEDTFTKQEIQAGYVTSGRDVIERQNIPGARRKLGGGGPSGTGKVSANPIFPPPTFDEIPKASILSAASNATSAAAAAATRIQSSFASGLARSNSLPDTFPSSSSSLRSKSIIVGIGAGGTTNTVTSTATAATTTAASVVAAGMLVSETSTLTPSRTTTLTPLTPLKPRSISNSVVTGKSKTIQQSLQSKSSYSSLLGATGGSDSEMKDEDVIGGSVIAINCFPSTGVGGVNLGGNSSRSALLGGEIIGHGSECVPSRLSSLGGEIFTGDTMNNAKSVIGSNWKPSGTKSSDVPSFSMISNDPSNAGAIGRSRFSAGTFNSSIGVDSIGGTTIGYGSSTVPLDGSGSSTLASMLSMNHGSLGGMEGANPFFQSIGGGSNIRSSGFVGQNRNPGAIGPIGSNNISAAAAAARRRVVGTAVPPSSARGIGTMNSNRAPNAVIGPSSANSNNTNTQSDIALLQSLLPGVHITSGLGQSRADGGWTSSNIAGMGMNWNNSCGVGGENAPPPGGMMNVSGQPGKQTQQQQQQMRDTIW